MLIIISQQCNCQYENINHELFNRIGSPKAKFDIPNSQTPQFDNIGPTKAKFNKSQEKIEYKNKGAPKANFKK